MFLLAASKTDVIQQLWPDSSFWIGLLILSVTAGGTLWWFRGRWREDRAHWADDADGDVSRRELLSQFHESAREGVLTAEEYRLIKSRLVPPVQPVAESERRSIMASAVVTEPGRDAPNRPPRDGGESH